MSEVQLRGVWAAALTPVGVDLLPDAAKAVAYYRDLLDSGCDGVNVLGTTGQASAFTSEVRLDFMQAVARSLPLGRCIVGTGAASLDDTVVLSQAAFELGFAAALVLPPESWRDAGEDGVLRFFQALLARAGIGPVLLYNFPRLNGIAFTSSLVDRLCDAFPRAIIGVKDSSNDRNLQRKLLSGHSAFAVFPSSEACLRDALADGACGCISGSVALWPQLAQSVYRDGDERAAAELARRRQAIEGKEMIASVRRAVATQRNDDSWLRSPEG